MPKLTIVNVEVKEYLVTCQILQSQLERCSAEEGTSRSDVLTRRLEKKSAKLESSCRVWNGSHGFWMVVERDRRLALLQGELPSSEGVISFSVLLKTQKLRFPSLLENTDYSLYLV